MGLAASYDQLGRFDFADRAYDQLLKVAGRRPEIVNNMGYSQLLRGNKKKASQLLNEARNGMADPRWSTPIWRCSARGEGGSASRSWRLLRGLDRGNPADIHFALRMPGVVSGLHAQPDSRTVTEQLAKPHRDSRRYRLALFEYVMEMLARNPQQGGDFRFRPASRGNDVIPQHFSRVSGAAARIGFRRIFSHFRVLT